MHNLKKENGFTLVELAIVLVIFGFVVTTVMFTLSFYNKTKQKERTLDSIKTLQASAFDYRVILGYYPCPADPALSSDDPNYGWEARLPPVFPATLGNCNNAVLTRVMGRDTDDADGDLLTDPNGINTGGDLAVFIGAFPFKTIMNVQVGAGKFLGEISGHSGKVKDLSARSTLDGWAHKITYAVTEDLTHSSTFTETGGAIDIRDEFDRSLLVDPATAHFALISHGINGRGAYTENGNLIEDCIISISNPALIILNGNENENCDENDAIFLSALRGDRNNNDYFDDVVSFRLGSPPPLWVTSSPKMLDINNTPGDPTDDVSVPRVINTNPGNVGIGIENPLQRLQVDGDVQARKIMAEAFCGPDDSADETCMPATVIAGYENSMQCPLGKVARSISDNSVQCEDPFAGVKIKPCPPPTYMVGVNSKDGSICE